MVFSSLFFLYAFFPLNLLCYWLAPSIRSKNIVALCFSLVFYAWAGPKYVLLLVGMTLADWLFCLRMDRSGCTHRGRKLCLIGALTVNLGLLCIFKYLTFLLSNTNSLFGWPETVPQIVLPVGISFYTFQLISYVVDVYRREVPAQPSFWKLLLYVSMFHQCIAGPIVRYQDVADEIDWRRVTRLDMAEGAGRFAVGLAKKAMLANPCGALANTFLCATSLETGEALTLLSGRSVLSLWLGVLAYTMQIYLDFSAYSDMAIGMGRMIGFHYRENFNYPYISKSVTEFWRRWHMSLSYFFRDYVYIPLGGSYCSRACHLRCGVELSAVGAVLPALSDDGKVCAGPSHGADSRPAAPGIPAAGGGFGLADLPGHRSELSCDRFPGAVRRKRQSPHRLCHPAGAAEPRLLPARRPAGLHAAGS